MDSANAVRLLSMIQRFTSIASVLDNAIEDNHDLLQEDIPKEIIHGQHGQHLSEDNIKERGLWKHLVSYVKTHAHQPETTRWQRDTLYNRAQQPVRQAESQKKSYTRSMTSTL